MTYTNTRKYIMQVVIVTLALFHLTSGIFGNPNTYVFRSLHLDGMMIIILMQRPFSRSHEKLSFYIDILLSGFLVFSLWYVIHDVHTFVYRMGSPTRGDIIVGTIFIILLLELARRVVGWVMVAIAVFFFTQNLFAIYMPGFLKRPSLPYSTMIDFVFLRTEGILGLPIATMSTYVVLFMIFAALLSESSAGDFFISLATAITGRSRGGPAKAAVVASATFGTISGSAIANVAGTGCVTIPLMKKVGYEKNFAGAVEAVSSAGGQIMPPMMGAAAFIVAQNVGIPYIKLAACAAIPACLYFMSIFFQVDFRAGKMGLQGTPEEYIPNLKRTLADGAHLTIPIIAIVWLMASGKSAPYSALMGSLILLGVTSLKANTRMNGRGMLRGIMNGIKDTASVSVTAAAAGIIIGGVANTGLNLIFATQVLKLSHNNMFLTLLLTALAALVLGMGMTTTAVYITVATILSPALMKLGINPVAAHLFCFYFGCICVITPPVALASFTAAGISGGSPSKTGWISFRLGIVAFIVPFIFCYHPALILLDSTPLQIIQAVVTASVGCWALSAALEGWLASKLGIFNRVMFATGAIFLLIPGMQTDIAGAAILAVSYFLQSYSKRQETIQTDKEVK
jgi:TRAP transporter 4TM/12TM fusion protein